jgi:hypothetical protein
VCLYCYWVMSCIFFFLTFPKRTILTWANDEKFLPSFTLPISFPSLTTLAYTFTAMWDSGGCEYPFFFWFPGILSIFYYWAWCWFWFACIHLLC